MDHSRGKLTQSFVISHGSYSFAADYIILKDNQFATCKITSNENQTQFTGKLSYKGFESGTITGCSLEAVRNQYLSICSLLDNEGGMLRCGTIMLGYHNEVLKGDVLLTDGEVIGRWEMEEYDEWSCFFCEGHQEATLAAPSPWMLQERIADWLER